MTSLLYLSLLPSKHHSSHMEKLKNHYKEAPNQKLQVINVLHLEVTKNQRTYKDLYY